MHLLRDMAIALEIEVNFHEDDLMILDIQDDT